MTCGAERWAEAMYFCPTDGMWVCSACAVRFGLADPTPRCPRCHGTMSTGGPTDSEAIAAQADAAR